MELNIKKNMANVPLYKKRNLSLEQEFGYLLALNDILTILNGDYQIYRKWIGIPFLLSVIERLKDNNITD